MCSDFDFWTDDGGGEEEIECGRRNDNLCRVLTDGKGWDDEGSAGQQLTHVGIQLSLVEVVNDAFDVFDSSIGLEVSSDEEFAGLENGTMVNLSLGFGSVTINSYGS